MSTRIGHLQTRVTQLEEVAQYLNKHQNEQMSNDEVPALANAIFDHTRVHIQAELSWTKDVLTKVEAGEYP